MPSWSLQNEEEKGKRVTTVSVLSICNDLNANKKDLITVAYSSKPTKAFKNIFTVF